MKYLIFVLLFLSSCIIVIPDTSLKYTNNLRSNHANPMVIPVMIDKNFDERDQGQITRALNDWNYALNGYIEFLVVSNKFDMEERSIKFIYSNNGLIILKVDQTCKFIPPPTEPDGITMGWTNGLPDRELYFVRDAFEFEKFHKIALHELGHFLGLEHINEAGLMNHIFENQPYDCVDKTAADGIAKLYHIDINNLNYCALVKN